MHRTATHCNILMTLKHTHTHCTETNTHVHSCAPLRPAPAPSAPAWRQACLQSTTLPPPTCASPCLLVASSTAALTASQVRCAVDVDVVSVDLGGGLWYVCAAVGCRHTGVLQYDVLVTICSDTLLMVSWCPVGGGGGGSGSWHCCCCFWWWLGGLNDAGGLPCCCCGC